MAAFARLELAVTIAVVVVLGAVVLSYLGRMRRRAAPIACVNNLKQIGIGFRLYANDTDGKYPGQMPEGLAITNQEQTFRYYEMVLHEIGSPKVLICPQDQTEREPVRPQNPPFRLFSNRHLSYFVSLTADESRPDMILAGDRNLTANGVPVRGVQALSTNILWGWDANRLHRTHGNVAMADGSVAQVTAVAFQETNRLSGATNILSIP